MVFDPAIFDPAIFDTGSAVTAPPTSPGTSPIQLFLGGYEVGALEWEMTTEEVVGAVGRATIIVQDRDNSDWEPVAHQEVRVVIRSSGWVLFHGETLQPSLSLPPGFPWRRWTIACRDRNAELDERLVGAPDGGNFWRPNATENYRPIDPSAISGGTDLGTVQDWYGHYLRGVTTADYVFEYVPNEILGSEEFMLVLYDAMTNVRSALDQLAAIADVNVQDWIDPDDKAHHQAIPAAVDLIADGDTGDLEEAPFEIGPGGVGLMAFSAQWDGQTMPQLLYGQGATTFAKEDDSIVSIGGSGWMPINPDLPDQIIGQDPTKRQGYLSIPSAWSQARRDAIGNAAVRRGLFQTLRASVTVQGQDGLRAGQWITINDARFPPSLQGSHKFVIQRVAINRLYPTTDIREYTIDIGDGAVGRMSQASSSRQPAKPISADQANYAAANKPIITWTADWYGFGPIAAGESRDAVFTPRNGQGEAWGPPGVPIHFRVEARQPFPDGSLVAAQGSCDPANTVTDRDGKARTTFTAGDIDGLTYDVFAETTLPPVTP